jgi:hydrogenase/urease accessory protein HupE
MRRLHRAWIALALMPLAAGMRPASAHPLVPALLDLREHADGRVAVTWKQPALRPMGSHLEPVLPARCSAEAAPLRTTEGGAAIARWTVACAPRGLVGQRVGVHGLATTGGEALLRIALADGRVVQRVQRAGDDLPRVPPWPRRIDVFRDYAALGVEHMLSGADHLCLVLGLLLLVPTTRLLVETITAFTVGHSVTLSLAVLGLVPVPAPIAEVLIALSVLALATELARGPTGPTLLRRYPWTIALVFGLLHGLGFAGALREAGLPSGEVPLALAAFNAGIEAGQLGVVVVVLLARDLAVRLVGGVPRWLAPVPAYAIGSLAAFWVFARAAQVLP